MQDSIKTPALAEEVELKFALADADAARLPGRLMRGYALAAGLTPQPPQRRPLKPKMEVRDAIAAIARDCIATIAIHAPLVLKRGDVEDVHRMRVGVRKLCAAISTFRRAMDSRRLAFEGDLRWLQDKLGAVRNWDVVRADVIGPIRKTPEAGEEVAPVEEAGSDARDAA